MERHEEEFKKNVEEAKRRKETEGDRVKVGKNNE